MVSSSRWLVLLGVCSAWAMNSPEAAAQFYPPPAQQVVGRLINDVRYVDQLVDTRFAVEPWSEPICLHANSLVNSLAAMNASTGTCPTRMQALYCNVRTCYQGFCQATQAIPACHCSCFQQSLAVIGQGMSFLDGLYAGQPQLAAPGTHGVGFGPRDFGAPIGRPDVYDVYRPNDVYRPRFDRVGFNGPYGPIGGYGGYGGYGGLGGGSCPSRGY